MIECKRQYIGEAKRTLRKIIHKMEKQETKIGLSLKTLLTLLYTRISSILRSRFTVMIHQPSMIFL